MKFLEFLILFASVGSNFAEFPLMFHLPWVDYRFQMLGVIPPKETDLYKIRDNTITGMAFWRHILFLSVLQQNNGTYPTNLNNTMYPLNYFNVLSDPNDSENKPFPQITPYPPVDNIQEIRNVNQMVVDACHRLWFFDSVTRYLHIIMLDTDEMLRKIKLNKEPPTTFISLAVEVNESDCENAYAYMPYSSDNVTFFVYQFSTNKYWWVEKPLYFPELNFTSLTTPACAVARPIDDGFATFYIQPKNSTFLLKMSSKHLQDPASNNESYIPIDILGDVKGNQTESNFLHYDPKSGVLFFDVHQGTAIGCWNPDNFPYEVSPYTTEIFQGFSEKEVIIGLATNVSYYDGAIGLWIGTRKPNETDELVSEYNFYGVDVVELVNNTVCE